MTAYAYDAFNRTAKVEKPDGTYVCHEYDPEGLRSGICENGVTSRFVFDGWNMVNELDEEWNAKASYVRGHELLAQVDGQGDAYYYLNNQHGDVVHITNRLGGIVNSYEYDAFGHTLSATEGIPNRFRYAGEQFDPVTQQYYLRAVLQPGHCPVHPGGRVPRRRPEPVRVRGQQPDKICGPERV
ncbi:hypothetical protein ABEV00_10610 [Paenibacillus thiaminolyticus]|uniref:RHS repeat domain-containing protein n=1 Tax=Paenibacillus thiaminolyticus TaxID=49283 RepID=UPI003D2AADA1